MNNKNLENSKENYENEFNEKNKRFQDTSNYDEDLDTGNNTDNNYYDD